METVEVTANIRYKTFMKYDLIVVSARVIT
jgi:hypothetical protein